MRHTWCTHIPPPTPSSHALDALDADGGAHEGAPAASESTGGAGGDAVRTAGADASAPADGAGGGGAEGVAAVPSRSASGSKGDQQGGGAPDLLEQLLSGSAPHVIDAEELQLDQEIAQASG